MKNLKELKEHFKVSDEYELNKNKKWLIINQFDDEYCVECGGQDCFSNHGKRIGFRKSIKTALNLADKFLRQNFDMKAQKGY